MELNPLTEAAGSLSRAAPAEWENFLRAMSRYYITLSHETVLAGADTVMHIQGRARQVELMLRWFAEINKRPSPNAMTPPPKGNWSA